MKILFLFVLFLALPYKNVDALSASELKSIMGDKACIEGVLVTMSHGPTLITSTAIPQKSQLNINLPPLVKHYESDQEPTNTTSATTNNYKEISPMYLINDLARYNNIEHQYHLVSDEGPAHKKTFTVSLQLGSEEYEAQGASIKKAQNSVAAMALQQTEFTHPPLKANRGILSNGPTMITPTVELNALAAKRGEKVEYVLENDAPTPAMGFTPHQRNVYNPKYRRYNYGLNKNNSVKSYHTHYENRYHNKYKYQHRPGEPFSVTLRVGDREYSGTGYTIKAARHDAAAKAIEDTKQLEVDEFQQCSVNSVTSQSDLCPKINTQIKSPISLVYEIAQNKNLDAIFEVVSEEGPPHMKVFTTRCRIGEFVTEGEGNSKQTSKKDAAEKMLDELSKLGPLPNTSNSNASKRKRDVKTKKQRNLIKVNTEDINPISRLNQVQQTNKENEAVYNVVDERGGDFSRREFVIEASINGHVATGRGPNKKVAKQNAAEGVLVSLGYSNMQAPQPMSKPAVQSKSKPAKKITSGKTTNSAETNNGGPKQAFNDRPVRKSVRAKDQLVHLGQLLGLEIQFSDFLKSKHEMYLTLVSLSTDPPQICQGEGFTTDMSHEKAALEALTLLSKLGLDEVMPTKESNTETVHGVTKPEVPKKDINQNHIKKET